MFDHEYGDDVDNVTFIFFLWREGDDQIIIVWDGIALNQEVGPGIEVPRLPYFVRYPMGQFPCFKTTPGARQHI